MYIGEVSAKCLATLEPGARKFEQPPQPASTDNLILTRGEEAANRISVNFVI